MTVLADTRATHLVNAPLASWELTIAPVDDATCELSNRVIVQSTPSFLEMLRQAGISDMSGLIAQFTTNTEKHNREETPFFARDIEIKAKAAALVGPRPLPV